jgi:hypothetical protein
MLKRISSAKDSVRNKAKITSDSAKKWLQEGVDSAARVMDASKQVIGSVGNRKNVFERRQAIKPYERPRGSSQSRVIAME